MAADASIKANLSGDASGLIAALEQAKQGVTKFGNDAANILNRKLGLKDVFKGVLQGVGIASVGQIVDKLVAPYRDAAESAQKLEEYTSKAADATERLIRARQDDNQRLDTSLKKMAQLQRAAEEAAKAPEKKSFFGFIQKGSALDKLFGLSSGDENARTQAAAKAALAVAEQELVVESDKAKVKATEAATQKEIDRMYKETLDEAEKLRRSENKLADDEKRRAFDKLSAEEKLVALAKEKEENAKRIKELESYRKDGGGIIAKEVDELNDKKGRQLELEKEIAEITKEKAAAEKLIGQTVASNIEQWKEFKVLVSQTGRDDTELSDRELLRKKQNIEKDLFNMERAGRETGAYQGGDYFQRLELNALNQELALRQRVRSYTASFGEERAFKLSGVSEQRFAEINQTNTKLDDVNSTLKKIERRLDGGILTLPTNVIQKGGG